MRRLHVGFLGSGPPPVRVHGSVTNGAPTWRRQRALADRFRLEIVTRPGFPPSPPVDRVDLELDAPLVGEQLERAGTPRLVRAERQERDAEGLDRGGDAWFAAHLVRCSYGGIVAMLAAALARRPSAR